MKLTYFGTAAYEGIPALGCECDTCKRARALGGRNIRTRCQALVDDALLLDFPPDTVWHFMQYGIDFSKLQGCLISHSHSDHLYADDLEILGSYYTKNDRAMPIRFFCGESGYSMILPKTEKEHMRTRIAVEQVRAFEKFKVGVYEVLPIRASHNHDSTPLVYRIEKEGKSMLFAHDTGVFSDESRKALERAGQLDLVSLDCTCAFWTGRATRHLSFDVCLTVFDEMKKRGIADENTKFIVNHFSHNGGANYDDIIERASPLGILVSYDGMTVEF